MKKVLTLILIIAMMIGFVACGDGGAMPTAEEIYNAYTANMAAVDALDLDMDLTIKMDFEGMPEGDGAQSSEIKMTLGMKTVNLQTEAPEMLMMVSLGQSGMTITMDMYYADGWMYINMFGMKVKESVAFDEIYQSMDMMELTELTSVAETINAEVFKDAVVTKTEDGNYQIELEISGESFKEMFWEMMMQEEDLEGIDFEEMGVEFNVEDIVMVMVFDKKYNPVSTEFSCVMQMSMEGETMTMGMDALISYNAFGKDVELIPPNLDEYVEASE